MIFEVEEGCVKKIKESKYVTGKTDKSIDLFMDTDRDLFDIFVDSKDEIKDSILIDLTVENMFELQYLGVMIIEDKLQMFSSIEEEKNAMKKVNSKPLLFVFEK